MTTNIFSALQSEWIKKRRSLSSWIVITGGLFTALVIIIARIVKHDKLAAYYQSETFWLEHWKSCWESMAIFLLPLSVILFTSLVSQMEFKNNTWKQVHALPLSFSTVFFSKLLIICFMLLQLFALFNIGIYVSAVTPALLFKGIPYPINSMPIAHFINENLLYFVCCLPIVALQYLISLRSRNFLVPVGVGFILWIAAISALSWRFGYAIPYAYTMYNYLKGGAKVAAPNSNIYYWSIGYFVAINTASYFMYLYKKDRG